MAQRVRTPAAALQQHFQHNIAVVVGINRYANVRALHTAEPDARYLANLLEDEAGRRDPLDRYKVIPAYDEDATCAKLTALLKTTLPDEVRRAGAATRVIFYFAGHGDAGYTGNTIKGYLFPQDARPREQAESERRLLAMDDVLKWLVELECQHVLIILDCCSAGAMPKTSATRSALLPAPLYWETLQRYVSGKTRQAITSAAHNQQASDFAPGYGVGERDPNEGADHSPFALALFEALAADPLHDSRDLRGAGRDGVVTATELYLTIADSLYRRVGDGQTPGLWTLNQGHEAGDYVFLLPGAQVQLEPAPDLTGPEHDPWPRAGNDDLAQALIAASREAAIRELNRRVEAKPLVAVTGRSSWGTTSLVSDMLLPRLKEGIAAGSGQGRKAWQVLPPLRLETPAPVQALMDHIGQALEQEPGRSAGDVTGRLGGLATAWAAGHPHQRLLLAVDCAQTLFEAATAEERARLWAELTGAAKPDVLHIILTVPGDHWETPAQADGQSSQPLLPSADRFKVDENDPFNRDGLRQVIDQPAAAKMIFLESEQLIGRMLDAVERQPGALPLLTETLHRMYMRHATGIKSGRTDSRDRTLTRAYYEAEGGVEGVIADLAQGIYDQWPDEDHRRSMQHVLMRLVKVEAGQYVGDWARQADFEFPDDQAARRAGDIIAALAACGLVAQGEDAAGEPYVELGHSGLITAWPQVQKWLVEQGAEWALQRDLAARVEEWQPRKPKTLLWREDPRLPQVEATLWPADKRGDGLMDRLRWEWRVLFPPKDAAPAPDAWVNQAELVFVRASVGERSGFRQKFLGAVVGFMIIVAALGGIAWWQRGVAVDNEARAIAAVTAEATARAGAEKERNKAQLAATAEADAKATAVTNGQIAREKQAEAERETALASSRELAARSSLEIAAGRLETAQLLAIQSGVITDTAQAFDAIRVSLAQPGRTVAMSEVEAINCQAQSSFQGQPGELKVSYSSGGLLTSPAGLVLHNAATGEKATLRGYPTPTSFGLRAFQSPTGPFVLIVGLGDNEARIWNSGADSQVALLLPATGRLTELAGAWSPSGQLVATAGCGVQTYPNTTCGQGGVWVWNASSGSRRFTLTGHSDWACDPRWLADDRLRTVSSDGTAREWVLTPGSELPSLSLEEGKAETAAPSQSTCTLSDAQKWAAIGPFGYRYPRGRSLICIADRLWLTSFSGAVLVNGLTAGVIKMWDEVAVFDAQLSFDDQQIALAGCRGGRQGLDPRWGAFCERAMLQLLDARDGRLLAELPVTGKVITSVSWSRDGGHLLLAANDQEYAEMRKPLNPRIVVIDTASRKEVFTISSTDEAPNGIAWSADNEKILAFGSNVVRQYFLNMQDLIKAACDSAPRNFTWDEWNRLAKGDYRPTCAEAPVPPDVIEAIHNQAKNRILAGDLYAAQVSLDQLNSWLAESGQLERYGVDPAAFIKDIQSEAKN